MLDSPLFRYFYLPWAAGVCLMLAVLLVPVPTSVPSEEVSFDGAHPIVVLPNVRKQLVRISPRFPGCTGALNEVECANQLLEDYLYSHTKYPASTFNQGTAGLAVIQVHITAAGRMEDISILRDPGYGRGEDALAIIRKMSNEGISWHPATINGSPIAFEIHLKVRYSNFHWIN